MTQPTPLELLTQKLEELKRSRDKSKTSFEEGKITEEEHNMHIANLTPMIEDYQYTIRVIQIYK